jgi:hypothetical protein
VTHEAGVTAEGEAVEHDTQPEVWDGGVTVASVSCVRTQSPRLHAGLPGARFLVRADSNSCLDK